MKFAARLAAALFAFALLGHAQAGVIDCPQRIAADYVTTGAGCQDADPATLELLDGQAITVPAAVFFGTEDWTSLIEPAQFDGRNTGHTAAINMNGPTTKVPEPGSVALLACGLLGLAACRRLVRQRAAG